MKIRGPKILVRKYLKPEKVGSIYINPAWRQDNSRSLWEVVQVEPCPHDGRCSWRLPPEKKCVHCTLQVEIEPDWILVTAPNSGVYVEHDEEHRELYLLAASSVRSVIPWTSAADDIKLRTHEVLVRLHATPETTDEGILVVREEAPPMIGTVLSTKSEEVEPGEEVWFSPYAGTRMTLNSEKLLLLHEESIMFKVKRGD